MRHLRRGFTQQKRDSKHGKMVHVRLPMVSPPLVLADSLSIFDPVSPIAASIVRLAILVFAVAGLIFLVVTGVLYYSVWRFREAPGDQSLGEPPQVYGSMPIEVAWTAAPR